MCASATAIAELAPPPDGAAGTARSRGGRRAGDRRDRRAAGARGLRAGRASRGTRAVRGPRRDRRRLPDHRPRAAADRLLRRRDRGDPRVLAVHAARAPDRSSEATDLPGRRAPARPRRAHAPRRGRVAADTGRPRAAHSTAPPDLVFEPDEVRRVWAEERLDAGRSRRRRAARPVPARAGARVRGAAARGRRARARRGRAGARVVRPRRPARGRRVPAPRGRTPHRQPAAHARRRVAGAGRASSPRPRASTSRSPGSARVRLARPRPRPAPRHADLPQAGPARTMPASAAPSSRSPTCAPATTSSTRTTASGSCSASRRRRSRASRATTSSSRSAARTASTSRTSRSARSRATSAPTRRRPALSKLGGKAWLLLKSRARESVQELAGELIALYARRQTAPGVAFDLSSDWLERLEAEFPYRETEDQQRAIEAVKEDLEAPSPMDRLVCGDVGFGKTEVACVPHSRSR